MKLSENLARQKGDFGRRFLVTMNLEVPEYEMHEEVQIDPAKSVLIIVDMQNDFVKEGGTLLVPDAEATIPRIRNLLDLARDSWVKVIFTQDTHNPGDPEWEIWPEHVREGTWGWQIVDELQPLEDELVIRKVRYDAFYGTHLDHFLRIWDVETLVICGTVANICVHYTAASAALRWFDVVIPRDATSALNPFDLEASLRQTSFLFAGRITQSENIKIAAQELA
jgi:nicotinamidase-related amidase